MSSIGWNHRPLGILRKALTRRRRLAHWRVSARVARMMDLPSVPYARRRIGEVWAIMLVKNEEDILAASVHHALRQGMDRVLVVDNGSTDATLRIVEEIAQTAPVLIGHDREVAYWQSEKMTYLARWAWARGADWIVPMDADEFWFAENDSTAEFLRSTPDDMVEARLWNLFPTERTPTVHTLAAGLRLDHGANTHAKVAARAHPLMWISMGNHRIFRPGMTGGGLHVAHLPWRSESQLARKATQGALALSAAEGLDQRMGAHWRNVASMADQSVHETWTRLLGGISDESLGWTPRGPFTIVDPSDWAVWPLGDHDRRDR